MGYRDGRVARGTRTLRAAVPLSLLFGLTLPLSSCGRCRTVGCRQLEGRYRPRFGHVAVRLQDAAGAPLRTRFRHFRVRRTSVVAPTLATGSVCKHGVGRRRRVLGVPGRHLGAAWGWTITDFDGVVAIMQTQGKGTAVEHGAEVPVVFDSDMRFMVGRYVGMDGQVREG